ncbi:hypothetical protein VTG60DRAFT_4952 [Thermothelomyces hinnuleus]
MCLRTDIRQRDKAVSNHCQSIPPTRGNTEHNRVSVQPHHAKRNCSFLSLKQTPTQFSCAPSAGSGRGAPRTIHGFRVCTPYMHTRGGDTYLHTQVCSAEHHPPRHRPPVPAAPDGAATFHGLVTRHKVHAHLSVFRALHSLARWGSVQSKRLPASRPSNQGSLRPGKRGRSFAFNRSMAASTYIHCLIRPSGAVPLPPRYLSVFLPTYHPAQFGRQDLLRLRSDRGNASLLALICLVPSECLRDLRVPLHWMT